MSYNHSSFPSRRSSNSMSQTPTRSALKRDNNPKLKARLDNLVRSANMYRTKAGGVYSRPAIATNVSTERSRSRSVNKTRQQTSRTSLTSVQTSRTTSLANFSRDAEFIKFLKHIQLFVTSTDQELALRKMSTFEREQERLFKNLDWLRDKFWEFKANKE